MGGDAALRPCGSLGFYGATFPIHPQSSDHLSDAMGQITKNPTVWLGQIEYPRRFTRKHLELAEGCLIYFWGANLNRKKLVTPPEPVCLIARWLRLDGEVRKNRLAIYRELPDVIWWDGDYWRTGNLKPPYPDY